MPRLTTTSGVYRNVLPVGLNNLAFIGLNATFQHVLTAALQARWLAAVLTGELKLPDRQQQLADIQARKVSPAISKVFQEKWLIAFQFVGLVKLAMGMPLLCLCICV